MTEKPFWAWFEVSRLKTGGAPTPLSQDFTNTDFSVQKAQNHKNKATFIVKKNLSFKSKSGIIFAIFQVFPT